MMKYGNPRRRENLAEQLTNSRAPDPRPLPPVTDADPLALGEGEEHELASTDGLGDSHYVTGLTAGQVLKATGDEDAAFATLDHSELSGVLPDQHHNQAHAIDGPDHTASGLTPGHVLTALTATTIGFAAPTGGGGGSGDYLCGAFSRGDISTLGASDTQLNNGLKADGGFISTPLKGTGALTGIAAQLSGDVGGVGDDLILTAYLDGFATALTVTITGGAGTEDSATATGSVSYTDGQELTVYGREAGTCAARELQVTVWHRPAGGGGGGGGGGAVPAGTGFTHITAGVQDGAAKLVESADVHANLKDPVAATAGLRTLGTGSAQAAAGNHAHAGVYDPAGTGATEAAAAVATHAAAADPHTGYQKESEKGNANGYASLGAGGLVPIAQLASGAPSGSKFIRDDGVLAVPAGGGTVPTGTGFTHITAGAQDAAAKLVESADVDASLKDPAAATAGLRTLGAGALQAAPGNHTHAGSGVAHTVGTYAARPGLPTGFDLYTATNLGTSSSTEGAVGTFAWEGTDWRRVSPTRTPAFGGRLTLLQSGGVPVALPNSDVTGGTTLYLAPTGGMNGGVVSLWNDDAGWVDHILPSAGVNLPLSGLVSGTVYDVFVHSTNSPGSPILVLELVAWASATARAAALVLVDGVYTKGSSGADANKRYCGTIRATGATTCDDTLTQRFVWNMYNRVPRIMRVVEATDSWNYTLATFRQANAAAANELRMVRGLDGDPVFVFVAASCRNATALVQNAVGVGVDSTSVDSATMHHGMAVTTAAGACFRTEAEYQGFPGIGYRRLVWLERSVATGTCTWYGDNAATGYTQSGIWAWSNM